MSSSRAAYDRSVIASPATSVLVPRGVPPSDRPSWPYSSSSSFGGGKRRSPPPPPAAAAVVPKTPGKIELAGLLARAGLIGAACAELLADVPDADALGELTEEDYATRYGVTDAGARTRIRALLRTRAERRGVVPSYSRIAGVIRPPPGFRRDDRVAALPLAEASSRGVATFGLVATSASASKKETIVAKDYRVKRNNEEEEEEADLLAQVGGQMAVSILDC